MKAFLCINFLNTEKFSTMSKNNEMFRPVYEDSYVQVCQTTSSAVPGFYTIRPLSGKKYVVELSDTELSVFSYMQRQLRIGLKSAANVEVCGLYLEEHPGEPVIGYTIPFYFDKLKKLFSVDAYQLYTDKYLKSYSFSSSRIQIEAINASMINLLNGGDGSRYVEGINNWADQHKVTEVHSSEKLSQILEVESILEVFDENEVPTATIGKKYFICIGGSKNYQCFLNRDNMSKGEFLLSHEKLLDKVLKPVYIDDQVIVRQDSRYAIPGFYVISPKLHYRDITEVPQNTYERCMFVAREIKRGLLMVGITRSHVYYDEKFKGRMSAHFWVFPIHEYFINEHGFNPTIFSRDIWTYLDVFPKYTETRPQILRLNGTMKRYLNASNISESRARNT